METIKTTAIVEDDDHLKLQDKLLSLEKGSQIDLLIILKKKSTTRNGWKQVLLNVGTYSEEQLSEYNHH